MKEKEIIELIKKPSLEDLSKLDKESLIKLCLNGFGVAAAVIDRIELDGLTDFPRSGNTWRSAMHVLKLTKELTKTQQK